MYNKIYIMGPVGSGKTTFAKALTKKYNIKNYCLDKVAWDDDNGGIKRTETEAQKLLDDIINTKQWIIEDTGRDVFIKGREKADIIYYIKMSRLKAYYRITKRMIRQKLGKEEGHFKQLKLSHWPYYISKVNTYYHNQKKKLKELEKYKDKVIFITSKKMKKMSN